MPGLQVLHVLLCKLVHLRSMRVCVLSTRLDLCSTQRLLSVRTACLQGLDMAPYLKDQSGGEPLIYDCFAFSCHFGTFSTGHYTAFARSPPLHAATVSGTGDTAAEANGSPASAPVPPPQEQQWFEFNDSMAHPVSESQVDTKAAYLLFYRLRGCARDDSLDMLQQCKYVCYSHASQLRTPPAKVVWHAGTLLRCSSADLQGFLSYARLILRVMLDGRVSHYSAQACSSQG
jgi:Ubiquitin carboxyl-terminal hydrolase